MGDELDAAIDGLADEVPDPVCRAIRWLSKSKARWIRIPVGVACIVASAFWFMPIVGIEFLPIGLLLIAQDIPILRRPVGRMMIRLETLWRRFKARHLHKRST